MEISEAEKIIVVDMIKKLAAHISKKIMDENPLVYEVVNDPASIDLFREDIEVAALDFFKGF